MSHSDSSEASGPAGPPHPIVRPDHAYTTSELVCAALSAAYSTGLNQRNLEVDWYTAHNYTFIDLVNFPLEPGTSLLVRQQYNVWLSKASLDIRRLTAEEVAEALGKLSDDAAEVESNDNWSQKGTEEEGRDVLPAGITTARGPSSVHTMQEEGGSHEPPSSRSETDADLDEDDVPQPDEGTASSRGSSPIGNSDRIPDLEVAGYDEGRVSVFDVVDDEAVPDDRDRDPDGRGYAAGHQHDASVEDCEVFTDDEVPMELVAGVAEAGDADVGEVDGHDGSSEEGGADSDGSEEYRRKQEERRKEERIDKNITERTSSRGRIVSILPPDNRTPGYLLTPATRKALSKQKEFTTEDKELAKTNVVNRQVIIESKEEDASAFDESFGTEMTAHDEEAKDHFPDMLVSHIHAVETEEPQDAEAVHGWRRRQGRKVRHHCFPIIEEIKPCPSHRLRGEALDKIRLERLDEAEKDLYNYAQAALERDMCAVSIILIAAAGPYWRWIEVGREEIASFGEERQWVVKKNRAYRKKFKKAAIWCLGEEDSDRELTRLRDDALIPLIENHHNYATTMIPIPPSLKKRSRK
ncbi:hypothetical protein C8Q74DRAFT_1249797 [Fomes fomentarius]|nr:hypothetical protein C8Q74DRAFT_1249797 [Fomes fomentarius]